MLRGGDPNDPASTPVRDPAVTLTALTDDASSEIDSSKTYTHAISGGGPATVNGVLLEEMDPAIIPANILWTQAV